MAMPPRVDAPAPCYTMTTKQEQANRHAIRANRHPSVAVRRGGAGGGTDESPGAWQVCARDRTAVWFDTRVIHAPITIRRRRDRVLRARARRLHERRRERFLSIRTSRGYLSHGLRCGEREERRRSRILRQPVADGDPGLR